MYTTVCKDRKTFKENKETFREKLKTAIRLTRGTSPLFGVVVTMWEDGKVGLSCRYECRQEKPILETVIFGWKSQEQEDEERLFTEADHLIELLIEAFGTKTEDKTNIGIIV